MQKHLELTRRRVQAFASGLRALIYPRRAPVTLSAYAAPDRIPYDEAMRGQYQPIQLGHHFTPLWSTHWVKVDIAIPRDWKGQEVHLLWDSCSEACVWQNGQPLQGLTGSHFIDTPTRPQYRLARAARGGEKITLHLEVACNGLFGVGEGDGQQTVERMRMVIGRLLQAEIAVFDREAWDLVWDYTIVADMARHLPANTPRAGQALQAANAIANAVVPGDRATWAAGRAIAAEFLKARNGDGQHHLSAVGHAHIDTAWLWPLAETKRKCARTFASAVLYMEDYPDYKFACSQAQQYEWMKELYPGLYRKIKARVKEGRFVPAGGTWVEPDCNIPSGESLVRQFLYGQRYFRSEFGLTCTEFWNPDVFGYSGALPQIIRGAGMTRFLTQKLSWNQFNRPTSSTFIWEGIDGSRVLTHFPPADTYNAMVSVEEALRNVRDFKDHERANESYMLFGYGDGGGGPTVEMLEHAKRMADVDGLPRVQIRSPREFFDRCEADIKDALVWVGELYFELHRGTYTTQARNKLHNRRSEFLLRDVEFLAAAALAQAGAGRAARKRGAAAGYPSAELARLWKLVLLNQFHDIIPGSSINQVYADSEKQYADVLASGAALRDQALAVVAPAAPRDGNAAHVLAVNTLSAARTEVVELPEGLLGPQTAANGAALGVVSAPAMGYSVAAPGGAAPAPATATASGGAITLENAFVRAVFDRDGQLVSLFDKQAGREAIQAGTPGNAFVMFDDNPLQWDAWDVDAFHLEKRFDGFAASTPARVTESGPLRAAITFETRLSADSTLRQTVRLSATSARLDFVTEADWHERHKFLKVEFPFALRAQEATYEIQFGHLQRPTHANTTWDMARFEVSAHKWADLSEPDFGVALLNDCKYGYATRGNVMRLSLLRGPTMPDAEADQGRHAFTYALLPHAGRPQEAGVIEEGYRLNAPLITRATAAQPAEASFFQVSAPNLVIDTVKKAEDSDALIVRLYEARGRRASARLTSPLPFANAALCNLLEEDDAPLAWTDGGVAFEAAPFKIVTLKLW
jgi:alpha-mannosidase